MKTSHWVLRLLVLAGLCLRPAAAQYTMRTGAGTGPTNIAAASTAISCTDGVAISPLTAELFVSSCSLNRVFRIDSAGKLQLYAGSGYSGFWGDGMPAKDASLSGPGGIAFDASGNLYIADQGNHRIRRVDATSKVITTIAGTGSSTSTGDNGPAAAATLRDPYALAIDAAGNLYVADPSANKVRKIAAGTTTITTVAGNGESGFSGDDGHGTLARLWEPSGVAVDAAGNVYIGDSRNYRVRKVNGTTGLITTIAGNGVAGLSGDGGPAISAQMYRPKGLAINSSGNLLIADNANNRIRIVDLTNLRIGTWAGGAAGGNVNDGGLPTAAVVTAPTQIVAGPGGLVYFSQDRRVRKVLSNVITTVVGTGYTTPSYGGDGQPAVEVWFTRPGHPARDPQGNVYFPDINTGRVLKITPSTGAIITVAGTGVPGDSGDGGLATAARLSNPRGVALDSSGNLFIADGTNRIRKVNATTGIITTVAGTVTGYLGDGGPALSARFYNPSGIAFDADNNLYIADTANQRVRRIDAATGTVTTVAGNGQIMGTVPQAGIAATSIGLGQPSDVAIGPNRNLYIAVDDTVRMVNLSTGIMTTAVGGDAYHGFTGDGGPAYSARVSGPKGIAFDPAGNLLIADSGNRRIRIVSAATGVITTIGGTGVMGLSGDNGFALEGSFREPYDVVAVPNGDIWISDQENYRMRVMSPPCAFALNPAVAAATALGGTSSFGINVVSGSNCVWVATSNAPWITFSSATSGSGNGTIQYTVAQNPGLARTGTVSVGGLTFTVNQAAGTACAFTATPSTLNVDWLGRRDTFTVTGPNCNWTARSNASWLQVYPLSGSAGGTIYYTAFPNFTSKARTAAITLGNVTFSVTQTGNPTTNARRFLQMLYYNFMNRLPREDELQAWLNQMNLGQTRPQIADFFLSSEEFAMGGRFVAGLYVGLLNRNAEYGGWLFQRGAMIAGTVTPDSLVQNFITTKEFTDKNPGITDGDFVRLLYRQILLREGSPADVAFQAQACQTMGRVAIARAFLNAPEFRANTGPRLTAFLLYATLLARDPSDNERTGAMNRISGGAAVRDLITEIVNGTEFNAALE